MKPGTRAPIALAALALASCDALFVQPLPRSSIPIQLAEVPPELANVVAKVDAVTLTLTRPDGLKRDTTIAVQSGSAIVLSLSLEASEVVDGLHLDASLTNKGRPLFVGSSVLHPNGAAAVKVQVQAVPGQVIVTPSTVTFGAVGQSTALSATVRFATGDIFPSATPTWSEPHPLIAGFSSDHVVTARGNGQAAIAVEYRGVGSTVPIIVQQIPSSITGIVQKDTLVGVGQTTQLDAIGVDGLGSPLQPGAKVDWRTQNPQILTVSAAGTVIGVGPGLGTVVAMFGGRVAASVNIRIRSAPPLADESIVRAPNGLLMVGGASGPTRSLGIFDASSPTWSPDHTKIAFVKGSQLAVTDLQGSVQVLAGTLTSARWPEFSPDGSWIYFTAGGDELYRIHPDGTGLERLRAGRVRYPTVSPDGKRIAYATLPSGGDSPNGMVVEDIGGGHRDDYGGISPHSLKWSPDGQWIAYVSFSVHLIGLNPAGARDLTTTGFHAGLSWSPDGKSLLASTTTATVIDVATGQRTNLDWRTEASGLSWWR